MVEDVYYLIETKETLVELFLAYPQFKLFFASPKIWIHEESPDSNLNASEFSTAIKLLFLAQFRSTCTRLALDGYETVLAMMGHPPFDEAVFDQWWSLRRFDLSEQFVNALFRIDTEQFDLLATSSEKILAWLAKLQTLKDRLILNSPEEDNFVIDNAYYLIESKETLVELFHTYPQFRQFFLSPKIWIHEESLGARLNATEFSAAIKLLFLAQFRSDCARLKLDAYETVLVLMMGDPPFDEAVFDQWWSLRRFDLEEQFENAIFRIDREQFDLLAASSENVQAWLAKLQTLKDDLVE